MNLNFFCHCDVTSLLLAFALLFSRSVLTKIPSKTSLYNQMLLYLITVILSRHFYNFLAELVILPAQGVDPYFYPYFLIGFEYLL